MATDPRPAAAAALDRIVGPLRAVKDARIVAPLVGARDARIVERLDRVRRELPRLPDARLLPDARRHRDQRWIVSAVRRVRRYRRR